MTTTDLITAVQQAVGVDADGKAGPMTRAAIATTLKTTNSIAAIQTAVGSDPDGVLGKRSWQAIFDKIVGGNPQVPKSSPSKYKATLQKVEGRSRPPVSYLDELVSWGRSAPDEIFESNSASKDVFAKSELRAIFGPWEGEAGSKEWLLHRKAVMLEILRCLGGFESSWKWNCGVDTTNARSMANIKSQETGIFQVSYDSKGHGKSLGPCIAKYCGTEKDVQKFIETTKKNHTFAFEYCARLLRYNYLWDGPIKRNEINSSLKRDAVEEFKALLS